MIKSIIYILIVVLFYSCKDEYTICDLSTVVRVKCTFYKNVNATTSEAVVPLLKVTKISAVDPDYNLPGVSSFSLALNPVVDSVQYQISINDTSVPDTVTFAYTTTKINVSAICGDVYINDLKRVNTTVNTLDSIKISNSSINTTSGENVRIYF